MKAKPSIKKKINTTGSLYVCATPIGNLEDCSFRLIETLNSADLIASEDTRTTGLLLKHFSIKTKLLSLEKYNEGKRIPFILDLLEQGNNIALVSEAGTPNISDPGAFLIRRAHEQGFTIIPVPGASSITALISVSGILANQFYFAGFLSKKSSARKKLFDAALLLDCPICFFESAKRLLATLNWLADHYEISECAVGKELTKRYETIITGSLSEIKEKLKAITIKGEWCIVIRINLQNQSHTASIFSNE
ncbi:16S rRNA (cytidine(1402)-2'-O)-methyltransferase [Thermoproteota archaeon]